jgi:hypothetical protein
VTAVGTRAQLICAGESGMIAAYDVFDSTFAKQGGYAFIDPSLPACLPYGLYGDGSSI